MSALGVAALLAAYRMTTIAGAVSIGDGGPATAAYLASADGLAVDRAGNLYIAEAAARRVRKVDRLGRITTVAGMDAVAGFAPYGLAVDSAGSLLVADYGGRRVLAVGADGAVRAVAAGVSFEGPRNVAADAAGNVYVSDYAGHRVYQITPDGRARVVVSAPQVSYPAGLAVDPATGTLYVADSGNRVIRAVSGGQAVTVADGLGTPVGLAFAGDGRLFIADPSSARLYARPVAGGALTAVAEGAIGAVAVDEATQAVYFTLGQRVMRPGPVAVAGGALEPEGTLHGPMGVALDEASGALYIAEERGGRVRRLDLATDALTTVNTGSANPLAVAWDAAAGLRIADHTAQVIRGLAAGRPFIAAGDGVAGFGGDYGPATLARLNQPRGLAFNAAGNLYFADSLNHRIRRIGAGGFISTALFSGPWGQLNAPRGVALDREGNLYVADTGNHAIRRVSVEGAVTVVEGDGNLNAPAAVAVDPVTGLVLIADTFNHRICRVTAAGRIETIADGLNAPTSLAVDSRGRVYVADFDNNLVRMLKPADPGAPAVAPPPALATGLQVLNPVTGAAGGPFAPGSIAVLPGVAGNRVSVDGIAAAILPSHELRIELPRGLAAPRLAVVEVLRDSQPVARGTVNLVAVAPVLFAAVNEDGTPNSPENPAPRGAVISLFGTGEGSARSFAVQVGSAETEVLFAGPAPGLTGVFQVNARLPGLFSPPGARPLVVMADGVPTQAGFAVTLR